MTQPNILTVPFAQDAAPETINEIPITRDPSDPAQNASWSTGFPRITMQPLVTGGQPPNGQDFNGVLKALSEHIVYQNKGGVYKWSADVVAAGGYSKGAVVQAADGIRSFVSLTDNNTQALGGSNWKNLTFQTHTLAEMQALTQDMGVIFVRGMRSQFEFMDDSFYVGYQSNELGSFVWGTTLTLRPYELDLIGGLHSKAQYKALWAHAQRHGLVVSSWSAGRFAFQDVNSAQFRVPDLRNMFIRATGTDADNANARLLGSHQRDALQNLTGSIFLRQGEFHAGPVDLFTYTSGVFTSRVRPTTANRVEISGTGVGATGDILLNAGNVARTSTETRSSNTAMAPRIIAF